MPRTTHRPRLRTAVALALAAAASSAAGGARAADDHDPYFYKGYDYGSQSLFNPAYVLLNRGFDVLQLRPDQRNIFGYDYQLNVKNVLGNVVDPFSAISNRGWGRWLREEIFPLSWTRGSARWVPNYGLHLIGGGTTYTALREWFEARDAPAPVATAFSVATLYTAAIVNESLENNGTVGFNTDCLADLYVFDLAGILLFSIDGVNEFFSRSVIVSDWSLQPVFTAPHGDIHNQGNYYAAKWALPFYDRLRLFGYMGFSSLGGLSMKITDDLSISAAAGAKVERIASVQAVTGDLVTLRSSGALFLDRNESLLASVQVADVQDYFVHVNVYPNAFFHTDPGVGLFAVLSKDARFMAGVSLTRSFGFGVGGGTIR